MGKRKKASKPQGPKKREGLATTFQCLFCNHENSVTVKIDKKLGLGTLACKVCGQNFTTSVTYLSAGVDVYSDWVDACDAVDKGRAEGSVGHTLADPYRETDSLARTTGATASKEDKYEGDDFVVDDEEGMEQDYVGGRGGDDEGDDE